MGGITLTLTGTAVWWWWLGGGGVTLTLRGTTVGEGGGTDTDRYNNGVVGRG